MSNPFFHVFKKTYGLLSRYPSVVRLREAWRQRIQLRYWPWYRLPPRRPGTVPHARYKHELVVSLTSFPDRIHLVRYAIYSLLKQSLKPNRLVLGEDKSPAKKAIFPCALPAVQTFGIAAG